MIFAVGSFHEALIVTSKQPQCLENVITSKMNQTRGLIEAPKLVDPRFFHSFRFIMAYAMAYVN